MQQSAKLPKKQDTVISAVNVETDCENSFEYGLAKT